MYGDMQARQPGLLDQVEGLRNDIAAVRSDVQAVTSGNTFTLTSFKIGIPDPA